PVRDGWLHQSLRPLPPAEGELPPRAREAAPRPEPVQREDEAFGAVLELGLVLPPPAGPPRLLPARGARQHLPHGPRRRDRVAVSPTRPAPDQALARTDPRVGEARRRRDLAGVHADRPGTREEPPRGGRRLVGPAVRDDRLRDARHPGAGGVALRPRGRDPR